MTGDVEQKQSVIKNFLFYLGVIAMFPANIFVATNAEITLPIQLTSIFSIALIIFGFIMQIALKKREDEDV